MGELQRLSKLIGNIYDAALDPALWPDLLHAACDYVGGCAGMLHSQNTSTGSGQNCFSWGDDPHFTRLYFEKYIKLHPGLLEFVVSVQPEQVASIPDILPYDEYVKTKFFREWAEPQGYVDIVNVMLEKSASRFVAVGVVRNKCNGMIDSDARRRMRLLAPHFRRAFAIGNMIDLHKVEAATFADTLDGLSAALFLLDAEGRIRHANASGEAMLRAGGVVEDHHGELAATDVQGGRGLEELIAAATMGDNRTGAGLLLQAREGKQYITHILPLAEGARREAGSGHSAVAAVFMRRAELELPHPVETLAKHYRLTAAEMRVLLAIVEGGGVAEVARTLGVSEATVKTHLQRIFGKTGAARQADLVKLVAGFISPLKYA
jgi:DNA-binding CsgD family transcriptional regulator